MASLARHSEATSDALGVAASAVEPRRDLVLVMPEWVVIGICGALALVPAYLNYRERKRLIEDVIHGPRRRAEWLNGKR